MFSHPVFLKAPHSKLQRMLKKIVILGPESTGKSTLCQQLAEHYKTLWCPEFAREYLLTNGTKYTYDDLLTIAKGQLALEDEYVEKIRKTEIAQNQKMDSALSPSRPSPGLLFIDTDMYVMKVWCEFVFGNCHRFILDKIVERKYDLYLLCNIDLPWIQDPLREYPDPAPRRQLYAIYKDSMVNQAVPWVDIHGNYEKRLQTAIMHVDKLLA